jgi:hyperosmotically inducible periplasmic protein
MMKINRFLIATFFAGSTLLGTGCAHYGLEQTGSHVVSDSVITTTVKSALLGEKNINSLAISVETYNGAVQLSGFVDSQWQIDKAGQLTAAVHGVQDVINNLVNTTRE